MAEQPIGHRSPFTDNVILPDESWFGSHGIESMDVIWSNGFPWWRRAVMSPLPGDSLLCGCGGVSRKDGLVGGGRWAYCFWFPTRPLTWKAVKIVKIPRGHAVDLNNSTLPSSQCPTKNGFMFRFLRINHHLEWTDFLKCNAINILYVTELLFCIVWFHTSSSSSNVPIPFSSVPDK